MVFNLSDQNSIALQFLYELRDSDIQKDRMRFRRNLERVGEILAYEISKTFSFEKITVNTPVSAVELLKPKQFPVIVTILRAGVPFLQGFLAVFDRADIGFIGAAREEGEGILNIKMDYQASPAIQGRHLILADPMLATGKSAIRSLENLLQRGMPEQIHIACVIAAPEGIESVKEYASRLPVPVSIWAGAVDTRLNEMFYIVPGLGDAGDLSFGSK